jgi:RNA polymerase sigma-70 factor (ECF subfamily)
VKDRSDAELVALAQDGDADAFEAIYDRHAPGVARALASFAGPDRDLLDDLTQDVFFRVIKGLRSYTPSHPFTHWLFTIALNVGRNHARRHSKVIPVNPVELEGAVDERDSSTGWSEEVVARTLMKLVARLPVQMREVVSLRIGSEMSYGDIAELLGIPEGTARSRMHNAVRVLRDQSGLARLTGRKRRNENEG